MEYCETLLKPLGLCRIEGGKKEKLVDTVLPSKDVIDANAQKTAVVVESILRITEKTRPPSELYSVLRSPPYGLSDQMIELLLGVLFHRKRIDVFEGERALDTFLRWTSIGKMADITKDMDRRFQIGPYAAEEKEIPGAKGLTETEKGAAGSVLEPGKKVEVQAATETTPFDVSPKETTGMDGGDVYDFLLRWLPNIGSKLSREEFRAWWNDRVGIIRSAE